MKITLSKTAQEKLEEAMQSSGLKSPALRLLYQGYG